MTRLAILFILIAATWVSSTQAGVILPEVRYPDISSLGVKGALQNDLAFDHATKEFSITGSSFMLELDDSTSVFIGGVGATIEISGILEGSTGEADTRVLAGTIEIKGNIASGALATGGVTTLLRGTLNGVTSLFDVNSSGSDQFNVYFDVDQTSHLAGLFGNTGRTMIHGDALPANGSVVSFNEDFYFKAGSARADTNPTIPEPSSFLAWCAALACFCTLRSRRNYR